VSDTGVLTVNGTSLGAGDALIFDESAILNGGRLVIGGAGDDDLIGGAGNDVIRAGNGTNTLIVGGGKDTLTEGTGADTFAHNFPARPISQACRPPTSSDRWHIARQRSPVLLQSAAFHGGRRSTAHALLTSSAR
jgi:hypothetical protein